MKKLYSKKLGGEAFALDAAQLDTLKKAGYTVPSPEEVIADAAAVKIEPPEEKRAYVVFDFKTGAFKVRTRTQTLAESEVGGFVGEVVSAAILCGFVERADMDNPKTDAPATPTTASPLVNMLRDAFLRAANNKTAPAADKPTEAADAPEVLRAKNRNQRRGASGHFKPCYLRRYGGRVRPYFRRRRVRSYYGIRPKGRGRGAAE